MTTNDLTSAEAAALLGLSPRTVRWACASGKMRARRFGRDWLIEEQAVWYYELAYKGKVGRPPKG